MSDLFLRACLAAVRQHALAELRGKARVLVAEGAVLMGVADETGMLGEGCVFLQVCIAYCSMQPRQFGLRGRRS
jgi:hypothetical protein